MPRISLLSDEEVDPQFRPLLDRPDADSMRILAYRPEIFRRFMEFHQFNLTAGLVPLRLKELVRLRIAALNQSAT